MKKCLKCNKEYEDSDIFCPCCGEKLVETNVCQKCGYPVVVEDTYCRHCGHKIEKEYRCEKCNAVINEGAKFCSECGSNVTNPVVSIATSSNGKKAPIAKSKTEKILFYVANAISLALLLLMLVGCFGDLTKSFYHSSSSTINTSTVSISYFFGDAIKNYQQQMEAVKFGGYDAVASLEITFKYVFWILAIGATIFGLVHGSIRLYKAYKNEDYSEKNSVMPIAAFGTIPYLAIIALTNDVYLLGKSATESIEYGTTFGWGTTMILISLIVYVVIASANRLVCAILCKKDIVFESVLCGVKLVLSIVFFVSIGQLVSIAYNTSGANVSGHATTYSIVLNSLYPYSTGAAEEFSMDCIFMLVAIGLALVGTVFGIIFLIKLFGSKKMVPLCILGGSMVAFLLPGYIITLNSIKNYSKTAYTISGTPSDAFKISAIGVTLIVLTIVSLIGLAVIKKVFKKVEMNEGGTN